MALIPDLDTATAQLFDHSLSTIVESGPQSKPGALVEAIRQLDVLLGTHKESLHPQMRHFLEHRSYTKALAFLRGEDPAAAVSRKHTPNS